MINHVRTIILNKSDAIAGLDTGLAHSEFIEPVFIPYTFQNTIKQFQDRIYADGLNIVQKLEYTKGIMKLMGTKQFNSFLTYFDSRMTYIDITDDINNTINFDANVFISRLNKSFLNMPAMVALFHNPTNVKYISDLYKLWSNTNHGLVPVLAALFAYVYKVEMSRSK